MRMASVKSKTPIKNDVDFTEKELDALINDDSTPLRYAHTMDYKDIPNYEFIVDYMVNKGEPLVLSNTTKGWDRELFSWDYLQTDLGPTQLENSPRDNDSSEDLTGWTVERYLKYFLGEPSSRKRPRLYGKDMPCPSKWVDYIGQKLHPYFIYRGKCDLLNDLSEELKPLNLMIYVGFGGTYTPGHRDICGSLGHNVMTYAEKNAMAVWFCVASKDVERAFSFWREHNSVLLHDNFFMPLRELAKAPFPIYVIKQREGDFVLVPPESTHQVVNMGGRNIKVAWNTITSRTIEISFKEVIPRLKSLGKPEIYRIKAVAYYSLLKRTKLVREDKLDEIDTEDFPHLLRILGEVIYDEGGKQSAKLLKEPPHTRVCNFCHCDIFNRSFHCYECELDEGEARDMDYCLECVAEGRGCSIHKLNLHLVEHISVSKLENVYTEGKKMYLVALQKKNGCSLEEAKEIANKETKNAPYKKLVPMCKIAMQRVIAFKRDETVHCHQCKLQKPESDIIECKKDERGCHKVTYPHRPRIIAPKKDQAISTIVAPAKQGDPDFRKIAIVESKRFCQNCLWNRYGIKIFSSLRDKNWVCPFCEEKCNCAACLRTRGHIPEEYVLNPEAPQDHLLYSEHGLDGIEGSHRISDTSLPRPRQNAFKKRSLYDTLSPNKKSRDSLALIALPQQPTLIEAPVVYEGCQDIIWALFEDLKWPAINLATTVTTKDNNNNNLVPILILGLREQKLTQSSNILPWDCEEALNFVQLGTSSDKKDLFQIALEEAMQIADVKRNSVAVTV